MKIAYPMQLGGGNNPTEVASLDEFVGKLAGCAGAPIWWGATGSGMVAFT